MASEYLTKLAKEQKPREEIRELTKKEKWRNWWDYHKWHVVIAAAAVLCAAVFVRDVFFDRAPEPDYQVAFVGSAYLPEATNTALASALAELGEDLNGDGQVLVKVTEYPLFADEANYQNAVAAQVRLTTNLSSDGIFLFLMEDPALFQERFGLLAYPDGTVPEEGEETSGDLWYAWTECPVLTGLDLGEYTQSDTVTGSNQEILSGMYIARRAFDADAQIENLDGQVAFWEKILQGVN